MSVAGPGTADRGPAPIRRRLRRSLVVVGLGALVMGALPVLAGPLAAPAAADPGHPGTPHDPVVLFVEDFENVPNRSVATFLDAYTGASGMTYTADEVWIDADNCNGVIGSAAIGVAIEPPVGGQLCADGTYDTFVVPNAQAIGDAFGGGADNMVLAYVTVNDIDGDDVPFLETESPISLASANRFLAFSIDAAAVTCSEAHPLYDFVLVDGAEELEVNDDPIDPCTDPRGEPIPGGQVGRYATDAALLFEGTEVGIRLFNRQTEGFGNDAAVDNIQLLDATPQLDKEFVPTTSPLGAPVELRFTVTNTSEQAAKEGWSFVDTLAEGLTIDPGSETTTCTNGSVTVDGATITVSGDLDTGQVSCMASVTVRFSEVGTYPNDASNVTNLVGLNPPGAAQVTATEPAAFECTTTAFLSQGAPANLYEVNVITGENEIVAPEFFPENINAIGYNPLDNYIYGWITSGALEGRGIARIGSDHVVENLGVPSNFAEFGLDPATRRFIGDFDNNGHYRMATGVGGDWVQIDLAPGSDTYMQVLSTGPLTVPEGFEGYSIADWAFNPQDEFFYTTAAGPNDNKRLWRFDPATGELEDLVDLGNIVDGAFGGAVYSDANNNLFTSNNQSGEIWHVMLPAGPASFLADGPITPTNDGAICFNTVISPLGPVIELTKTTDTTEAVAAGSTINYTVTVTNVGNKSGFDVLVEDPLPDGIESGTWTCEGAACPNPSGDMPLSETVPELGIDETVVYTIDALVSEDPPPPAEIVNTATVTGPEVTCGDPDAPTLPPCEVTVSNPTLPIVTVDKTADVGVADPGDTVTYQIVVTNVGQTALDGEIVVSDFLPDGLASGAWACAAAGGAACPNADGAMPLAETVTELPAGGQITYTVVAVVSDDPPAEIVNVATVEGPISCQVNPITAPPCEASATVERAPSPITPARLAETGTDPGPVLLVAVALIGLGILLVSSGGPSPAPAGGPDGAPGSGPRIRPGGSLLGGLAASLRPSAMNARASSCRNDKQMHVRQRPDAGAGGGRAPPG